MAEITPLEQNKSEWQIKRAEFALLICCVSLVVSFFFGVPNFAIVIAGCALGAFFTHQKIRSWRKRTSPSDTAETILALGLMFYGVSRGDSHQTLQVVQLFLI
jgi:hypothetical protein